MRYTIFIKSTLCKETAAFTSAVVSSGHMTRIIDECSFSIEDWVLQYKGLDFPI